MSPSEAVGLTIGSRSLVTWDRDATDYTLQRCPTTVIGEPDDSALPSYVHVQNLWPKLKT